MFQLLVTWKHIHVNEQMNDRKYRPNQTVTLLQCKNNSKGRLNP